MPSRTSNRAPGTRDTGTANKRLRRAKRSPLIPSDVRAIVLFVVGVTTALWGVHGGFSDLLAGGGDTVLALGRITGLYAGLAALAGVLLAIRPKLLERLYGLDKLLGWHRWVGTSTVFLVVAHMILDSLGMGMATGTNLIGSLIDMVKHDSWMLAALVASVLFIIIGFTSWRRIRKTMSYETWYFVHLTAYLAVLMGFAHQITKGTDLVGDTAGLVWWIGLALVVVFFIVVDRVGGLLGSIFRGRLEVSAITREADGIGSVHISGPGLKKLRATPGQFLYIRLLTKDLWYQPHPFSLSAAPTKAGIRFTVKDLGDGSHNILRAKRGTRVLVEGPYGRFTAEEANGAPVLLVGGGVGVAPLLSILTDCTSAQQPVVVVRVRHDGEFPHRAEFEKLVKERNGILHVLSGPREWFGNGDPFRPEILREAVPNLKARHVFMCGPASMEAAAERGLRAAGVPTSHIHHERFGF